MVKKVARKIKDDQEVASRKQLLEELFTDFNRNRAQVYRINFIRGLFFGLGSVLGGTIIVAILIWILSMVAQHIPLLHDAVDGLTQTIESGNRN